MGFLGVCRGLPAAVFVEPVGGGCTFPDPGVDLGDLEFPEFSDAMCRQIPPIDPPIDRFPPDPEMDGNFIYRKPALCHDLWIRFRDVGVGQSGTTMAIVGDWTGYVNDKARWPCGRKGVELRTMIDFVVLIFF